MSRTVRRIARCLLLLAAWPLLQAGCLADAIQFELLNLVTNQVFIAARTIFDNLIDFDFQ